MIYYRRFLNGEIFRFALVGGLNTFIHAALLAGAVELLLLNVVLANLVAFLVANIFSYFVNSAFTFRVQPSFIGYAKFLSSSMLALMLTLGISALTNKLGLHYLIGFLFVVVFVPVFSFVMMKLWAFK
jgi:putative flippase GtrA